ncbi:MAG: DedA family protein [Deltaproteobacteria bacterium]|nr:DedA family protein [Deltaproteobacteria bacterium]
MSFEQLIISYGYPAIFFGTFFEGETVLILAGFLAYRGYLTFPWVIIWAFLGTLAGDQLYFFLGRWKGAGFIDSKPRWKSKTDRVFNLFHKHQTILIVGFRFIYGIRSVTPFIIGASGISPLRFAILNFSGAALWAVAIGLLGYFVGQAAEHLMAEIKRYEVWILIGIVGLGSLTWLTSWLLSRRGTPGRPSA